MQSEEEFGNEMSGTRRLQAFEFFGDVWHLAVSRLQVCSIGSRGFG